VGEGKKVTKHTYSIAITATDKEGDALTYSVEAAQDSGVTVPDAFKPTITFTPATAGTHTLKVYAADSGGKSDPYVITLEVIENKAPVFDPSMQHSLILPYCPPETAFSMIVRASDPDLDTVSFVQGSDWPSATPVNWVYLTGNVLTVDRVNAPETLLDKIIPLPIEARDPFGAKATFTINLQFTQSIIRYYKGHAGSSRGHRIEGKSHLKCL
jgi:hypothetical protein